MKKAGWVRPGAAWGTLALAAFAAPPAAGLEAGGEGRRITAVEVRPASPIARSEELLELVTLGPGDRWSLHEVRRSLRNLSASGLVGEAAAFTAGDGDGTRLIFAVRGQVHVRGVVLEGDLGLKEAELRPALAQRDAEPLVESRVVRGVYRLQDLLQERGYLESSVRVAVAVDEGQQAVVTYHLNAGPPARIGKLTFDGALAPLAAADLLERLKAGPGDRYYPAAAAADAERLQRSLVEGGFRLARVERPRSAYRDGEALVDLVYPVTVGPRLEVHLSGAELEPLRKKELLPFLDSERFDESLLLLAEQRLRRHFQERGHYRVRIATAVERGEERFVVRVEIEPGPLYRLAGVSFSGHQSVSRDELLSLVDTGQRRLLGAVRLVDEVLEADLANVRSYYALRGFAQARVGPPQIAERGDRLTVEVPIEEGVRRRVVNVSWQGLSRIPPETAAAVIWLRPGGPYHPRLLEESVAALRTRFQELAFDDAQISTALDWNEDRTLVDVTFRIFEGPRSEVDRVLVRGNRRTRSAVIHRALGLERGDPVTTAALLEAQRRLYALGIFSSAEVKPAPSAPFSGARDVVVRVEEGRRRRLTYGLGYDSEDGLRGLFGFTQTNLFGRAVTGRFDLRASEREQQVRALLRQPSVFGRRIPVTWSLFAVDEMLDSFTSVRQGFQVEAVRSGRLADLSLLYTYKLVEVDEPDPALREIEIDRELREVEVNSVTPAILVDRRDDPLTPTRGWSAAMQAEYAFPLLAADAEFLKLFSQGTAYLGLGPVGVLAGSLRLGAIEPRGTGVVEDPTLPPGLASRRIPISERFFAGGRTSHRAYRRDRLGLLGSTLLDPGDGGRGVPVGGTGLVLANLDLRFPIAGPVGGVVFVDSGNVWADWRDVRLDQLKTGAGIGVRYRSPIGPLRLEVGWKLDRDPGEDAAVLFLSFGNPF